MRRSANATVVRIREHCHFLFFSFLVLSERDVFAIYFERSARRIVQEQRPNGMAAAHVGPGIEARIADESNAINQRPSRSKNSLFNVRLRTD